MVARLRRIEIRCCESRRKVCASGRTVGEEGYGGRTVDGKAVSVNRGCNGCGENQSQNCFHASSPSHQRPGAEPAVLPPVMARCFPNCRVNISMVCVCLELRMCKHLRLTYPIDFPFLIRPGY